MTEFNDSHNVCGIPTDAQKRVFHQCMNGEKKQQSGFRVFSNGVAWQMDYYGNHRLIGPDGKCGEWALYEWPAFMGEYLILAQFYSGMPQETLIRWQVVEKPSAAVS